MSPAVHDVLESRAPDDAPKRISAGLESWPRAEPDPTLGALVAVFGHKSVAIVFVLLLGVPALPLPSGGETHLLELVAILLALGLVAGREEVWLPRRWAGLRQRFLHASGSWPALPASPWRSCSPGRARQGLGSLL